jgi:putative ABC transport system substrate-binding protein
MRESRTYGSVRGACDETHVPCTLQIAWRMNTLHEIVPAAAMIGYLRDPSGPFPEAEMKDAETAARTLGVRLAFLNASTPSQIETAFTTLVERRIGALTIGAGAFLSVQYEQISRLAARHQMPVIYSREFVDAGGLMSYGPNRHRTGHLAACRCAQRTRPISSATFFCSRM